MTPDRLISLKHAQEVEIVIMIQNANYVIIEQREVYRLETTAFNYFLLELKLQQSNRNWDARIPI